MFRGPRRAKKWAKTMGALLALETRHLWSISRKLHLINNNFHGHDFEVEMIVRHDRPLRLAAIGILITISVNGDGLRDFTPHQLQSTICNGPIASPYALSNLTG